MLLGWGSAAWGWVGCGSEEPPQPMGLPAGPPVPPPALPGSPQQSGRSRAGSWGTWGTWAFRAAVQTLGEPKALKIRYLRHTGDIFF